MAKAKQLRNYASIGDGRRYQVEEDLRCYMRVCEIKKDPARMKRVHKLAQDKLEEAAKVAAVTGEGDYS